MDESPTFDIVVTFVVEQFLFGWPMPQVFDFEDVEEVQGTFWYMDDPTEWPGINSDIDTKEKIEILLRLYPGTQGRFMIKKTLRFVEEITVFVICLSFWLHPKWW